MERKEMEKFGQRIAALREEGVKKMDKPVDMNSVPPELLDVIHKSIPKKPNGEYCPNCKRHLRKPQETCGYTGKVKRRNGDNYCLSCGQAIEWEE